MASIGSITINVDTNDLVGKIGQIVKEELAKAHAQAKPFIVVDDVVYVNEAVLEDYPYPPRFI